MIEFDACGGVHARVMWAEVAHVSMGLYLGVSAGDDVSTGERNGMTAFVA